MSDRLLPATIVHDTIPVRRLPEPPDDRQPPRLLWPSIEYRTRIENCDAPRFPAMEQVHERRNVHHGGIVLKLVAFEVAIESALARVLVLDPHFDEAGVNVLGLALSRSQALDVRLLTSRSDINGKDRERWRKTLVQHLNSNRFERGGVDVRWSTKLDKHSFPFLHDRFAIVDGALWHFGSTVGGGYPGLTAASGPWSASDTRAVEFFEECWRVCNA